MGELKLSIFNYINHFSVYDFMAYIWLLLIFFIILFMSLLLIKKSIKLSLVLMLFAFVLLFIAPFALKYFLDKTLRPVEISHISHQKLHFSNTLIVDCKIKNISKKPYTVCQINTKIYKTSNSKLKTFFNKLKPIANRTIIAKRELKVGATMDSRTTFYDFTYSGDINISINAKCYGGKR